MRNKSLKEPVLASLSSSFIILSEDIEDNLP